ncbi:MAG: MATE family efflux transporter [Pseudomonadota bacterium]|nr:MATE family efflux transporter [Pseudomonadota bacterium]
MKTPQYSWQQYKQESILLLKLALPILLAQLALTALGVVDTIMSGWVGTNDLAAIGLGTSIMLPIFMFSTGVLLALTPLVAKKQGEQQSESITRYLHQGLWLSLPLGLLSMILLMNLDWVLNWLQLSPQVFQLTKDYLFYIAFGLPAVVLYQALRFFWEGLGTTLPTMWISFLALLINIPLNALFIYGYGPVEALGAAGCGVASSIVMWLMFFVGLVYINQSSFTKRVANLSSLSWPRWQNGLKDILNLGIPTSLALLFEVSLFSFIALFIAKLGAVVIAGHQIAISFTSLAFMLPLSLAMALTVRMGKSFGQSNKENAILSLYVGIGFAVFVGVLLALVSYGLRHQIVAIYSHDLEVLVLAATLLIYAAYYQVFDAIQVGCAGALRGLHDTKVTMVVTFVSYWGIGLAGGYMFAYTDWMTETPMGVEGFWLGIALGLLLAAVLLSIRLKRMMNVSFKS